PEPTPTPIPTPTPAPTPTPTPAPTPTPGQANVGDYRCVSLAQARSAIEADGFTVGVVTGEPPGYTWTDENEPLVVAQNPAPGVRQTVGSPVDLLVYDPASYPFGTCPPPPA
ncbi:MAG: PASTA domain-containing protein, partial [Chloroflexi bacterium]|nr:PASTA domain-containing protein [Chloroflexota bacterium]